MGNFYVNGLFFDPRRHIQARLGLLFGGLTILLASVMSVAVRQQSQARIETNIGRNMRQMAVQLTDDLDRGTFDYYLEMQTIALDVTICDSGATLDAKRQALLRYQSLSDDLIWISLVNSQGQVIVSTDTDQIYRDVSNELWFINGQNAPHIEDVTVTSSPSPPRSTEPTEVVLLHSTTVWMDENQTPQGVIAAAINYTFVHERIQELLNSATPLQLQVIVTQADGRVIASSFNQPIGTSWASQASYTQTRTHTSGYLVESPQHDYLTGYAVSDGFRDFAGLQWRIIVRTSAKTAFAPAVASASRLFWTGLLLGISIAGLGWVLGSRMARPIVQMAAAADAIRTGREVIQLPDVQGQDEVAQLGQSLRALVDRLTHAISERSIAETQFRTMFEMSLDVILVADGNTGTILQVNPAVQRVLGYEPGTLVGQPFATLFPAEPTPRDELLERLKVYGAVIEEQAFRRHDGSTILMDLTATMMPYRGSRGILITLRDISERHQLQLAQIESDAMRTQLEAQEEALHLKSTIVSVASHDLRNPLATILLSSDIIRNYGDRIPEEKRIGHFLRIETSIRYMQKLLDDLNMMEKLERGLIQPTPEVIDLNEFCHTLMDEALAATESTTTIQLTFDPACQTVRQDPRLLRQAISNLLTNALKYSRDGQAVDFGVKYAAGELQITVRDYGIGIPLADQKDLFKTFHRAKNVGDTPGTGLGLAITRRAVDSMHGRLDFVSVEGEGTTFIIYLPLVSPNLGL